MPPADGQWYQIGAGGRSTLIPTEDQNTSSTTTPLPGNTHVYTNKIRLVFGKKRTAPELQLNSLVHKVIAMMFEKDTGMQAVISTKDGRMFNKIEIYPPTEQAFIQFFEMKEFKKRNGDISVTVYLKVKSTTKYALYQVSNSIEFKNFTKDNAIITSEHPFESQSMSRVGFFSLLAHEHIHIGEFQERLTQKLKESLPQGETLPLIAVNKHFTRHREFNNGCFVKMHKTDALEIECQATDIARVTKIVMESNLEKRIFGTFVPFAVHFEDPDLLCQMIADNNYYNHTTTALFLNGVHPEVMTSQIEASTTYFTAFSTCNLDIRSVERTHLTNECGRWKIIVPTNAIHGVITDIQSIITTLLDSELHQKHKNENPEYSAGATITKQPRQLTSFITNHITELRNTTTFHSPEANHQFHRPNLQTRRQQPTTGIINFSQSGTTGSNTNAWTGNNPLTSQLQNAAIQNIQDNNSPTSTVRTNNSRYSDNTIISQLQQQVESMEQQIGQLVSNATSTELADVKVQMSQLVTMMQALMSANNIIIPEMNIPTLISAHTSDSLISPTTNTLTGTTITTSTTSPSEETSRPLDSSNHRSPTRMGRSTVSTIGRTVQRLGTSAFNYSTSLQQAIGVSSSSPDRTPSNIPPLPSSPDSDDMSVAPPTRRQHGTRTIINTSDDEESLEDLNTPHSPERDLQQRILWGQQLESPTIEQPMEHDDSFASNLELENQCPDSPNNMSVQSGPGG